MINLSTGLRAITANGLLIDGTTQPGYVDTPLVELDGTSGLLNALQISAKDVTVKGLVVRNFSFGIRIISADSNTIQNNIIESNLHSGISIVLGDSNTIENNVIESNGQNGIYIIFSASNTIENNMIKSNQVGIYMHAASSTVQNNIVESNQVTGIHLNGGPSNTITENTISANGRDGVFLANTDDNVVEDNVITGNTNAGVATDGVSYKNFILSNTIHSNGDLGIDQGNDGVTPNDDGDSDGLQNYPVLESASKTCVSGYVQSTPNTDLTIQIFANSICDPTGYGEGEELVAETTVMTDGAGEGVFSDVPLFSDVSPGTKLTATATSTALGTSEFSACLNVPTPPPMLAVEIQVNFNVNDRCVNTNSRGLIPVAIMSTVCFDATEVDPSTVEMNGLFVKYDEETMEYLTIDRDVNGDSLNDFIVYIRNEPDHLTSTTVVLTGQTFAGVPIMGKDTICLKTRL